MGYIITIYSVTKFPFCDSLFVNHGSSAKIANHDFIAKYAIPWKEMLKI